MRPVPILLWALLLVVSSSESLAEGTRGEICIQRADSRLEQCEPTLGYDFLVAAAGEPRVFIWSTTDGSEVAVGLIPADRDRLDLTPLRRMPLQIKSNSRDWPLSVTVEASYGEDDGHAATIPSVRVPRLRTLLLPRSDVRLILRAPHHSPWTRVITAQEEALGVATLKVAPFASGSVVADDTPLLAARVAANDVVTETDALGQFRLEFPDGWPDAIRISAAGYADKLVPLPKLQSDVDLGVIALSRGGTIRARFGDSKVDSAKLLLRRGGRLVNVRSAKPVDGVLELSEVDPGSYVLLLSGAQPLQRFSSEVNVDEAAVTDVTLPVKRRELLIGVTADDRPVVAQLEVMPSGGEWTATLATDESGTTTSEVWQEGEFHVFTGRGGSDSIMTREFVSTSAKPEINWSIILPTNRIEGRVTDDDGSPLPGVRVILESIVGDGASKRSVDTRADGSFEFSAVPPGRQSVTGTLEGYLKASATFEMSEDEQSRTVALKLARASVQIVNVVDSGGRPIPRAVLLDDAGTTVRIADHAGSVALDLKQGSGGTFYVLPPQGSFATVQISPSRQGERDPIRVVVPPGVAQLRILAKTRKGAPVPGVFIALRHDGRMLPLSVQFAMLDRHGVPVQTGPDGSAVLSALPAGLYEVWPYFTRGEIPRIFNGLVEPGARLSVNPGANVVSFTFDDPRSD